MDDDLDTMFAGFRADTGAMRRELAELKAELGGPLVDEAERAGRAIERSLVRAIAQGKFGFEDLKRVALSVMAEISASVIKAGISAVLNGPGGSGGGSGQSLMGTAQSLALALLGAPGRATGGPVSDGRAYWVGERGPELFVPTSNGRVEAAGGGGARNLSITVNMQAAAGQDPQRLVQSGRQLAQAVRRAVMQGDG